MDEQSPSDDIDPRRRGLIKSSALLGAGVSGSGLAAAGRAEETYTPADGPGKQPDAVKPHDGGPAVASADAERALIVKDCNPWYTQANETVLSGLGVQYSVVNSTGLADESLEDYDLVVLPSTQPDSYYDRLEANADDLSTFVQSGGTLAAHVANSGYPCAAFDAFSFLPRGVSKTNRNDSNGRIVTSDHPGVAGISESNISGLAGVMADLTGVPSDARVVVENGDTGAPVYAEYTHGEGTVLAVGYTIEFPYYSLANPDIYGTRQFLANHLGYALDPQGGGAPGSGLDAVVDRKLALADSVDENGLGYLADRAQVEPALDGLDSAVSDGDLAEAEATEAVERMILGEQVTDAVLAGAGPGSSEHLAIDTNISKLTAQNAVNPVIELLFAGLSVVRAARHIPFVGGAAKRAANFIADLVADVAGKFSRSLERLIRRQGEDAGFAILNEVESRAKDRGKPIAEDEYVEARDASGAPFIEDNSQVIFRDFLFSEEYDLQGNHTEPLDEPLADLIESLDAEPDGPEHDGDDAAAREANERALEDIADIYEGVDEALTDSLIASILKHIGILTGVLALVAFIAGVTGVGTAAGAVAGVAAGLLAVGVGVPLSMAQWGTGSVGILAARYRHQNALPEIVSPN